jgi:Response regulators consisting of a CheY-like receiver domain and a winged-helix DNA-binding domain
VVEDNPGLRLFLVESLSNYYKVSEASDGLEALSLVKSYNPDLVISDIMMPIMDGNEMCTKIKDTIETSHVPVILLTALNDKDSIIKGLQTKADKYVTKPFDFEMLMATIENIFANRQIIKEAFAKGNFNYLNDDKDNNELNMDQEFLLKVVDNIKKNIAKDINVEMLCSNLNMSRSSFYNKIKSLTEYSPSDYIRKIKMAEAAKLLLTKKYTIAEVADMVGFGDPKYFTRHI